MGRVSPRLALILLTGLLLLLAMTSVNIGALSFSLRTLWNAPLEDMLWQVWLNIRLPRVLLAIIIGMALAISGAMMQGLFRNPLADPTLLGMSSGASLSVVLVIVLPLTLAPTLMLYSHMIAAFAGSLLISFIIYQLSRRGQSTRSRLLLAGIGINALCFSLVGLLSYLSTDQQLRQFTLWSMGSLAQAQWPALIAAASVILVVILLSLKLAGSLNLLQLGDEEAHYLGTDVAKIKRHLLLLNSVLIGCCVAVSGIIGFIGLVVPHLVRLILGADHRWLLPCSALSGACLLLVADTLARILAAPAEIPVGILTSLIGSPYFLWLLLRQRESGFE